MNNMSERREKEQQYASKWRIIANYMKNNTGLRISGVARAGSRRRGEHEGTSDLDILFKIPKNPSKETIYPELKMKLKNGFRTSTITIGSSFNAIKMKLDDLMFDIVLRTEEEFDEQVKKYKLEYI